MKKIIFYILCALTVFSFLCIKSDMQSKMNIPPVFNQMNIIVETQANAPDDVILKADREFLQIPPSKNMLNKAISKPVRSLEIYIKENFKNEIKSIVIFNDLKLHYFKDFSEFEKSSQTLCPNNICSVYNVYKVPNSVKFNKKSEFINYRYPLNTFCARVFSLFGVFVPYIFLFLTIFYFKKNEIKVDFPKISGVFIFLLILALSAALRFNGLFDYLPWADECSSVEFSRPNTPFLTTFIDPGNPPLFYIMLRMWFLIFGESIHSLKVLPFIFGVLGVFSIWFVLKKQFNLKTANLGAFLACINIPLIYYSDEARGYIVQAFLTPFVVYFLFKILKDKKNSDFIIYALLTAVIINIHYYGVLLVFFNFLYGVFALKKEKPALLKFIISNVLGGAFLLPFFAVTAFKKALLAKNFNDWLPPLTYPLVKSCVLYVFGGAVSLFLSIFIFAKYQKTFSSKERAVLFYLISAIFGIIIQAVLISIFLRPIVTERYFIVAIPLFIMFLAILFNAVKLKYGVILFIIWVLLIQNNTVQKNNRRKAIIDGPLIISHEYSIKAPAGKNIYVVTNLSSSKHLKEHKKLLIKNATYIAKKVSETENIIKEILQKDKKAVIFTSILDANAKNSNLPDNYSCYFNSATDVCIWRIENE